MGKQIADRMFSKLLAFPSLITLFVAIVFMLEKARASTWIWVYPLLVNQRLWLLIPVVGLAALEVKMLLRATWRLIFWACWVWREVKMMKGD